MIILDVSQICDISNLEGWVPVVISHRNRVAQLYPQALRSLFVASCEFKAYGGGILTPLQFEIIYFMIINNVITIHDRL
jgi:hypothetical protein